MCVCVGVGVWVCRWACGCTGARVRGRVCVRIWCCELPCPTKRVTAHAHLAAHRKRLQVLDVRRALFCPLPLWLYVFTSRRSVGWKIVYVCMCHYVFSSSYLPLFWSSFGAGPAISRVRPESVYGHLCVKRPRLQGQRCLAGPPSGHAADKACDDSELEEALEVLHRPQEHRQAGSELSTASRFDAKLRRQLQTIMVAIKGMRQMASDCVYGQLATVVRLRCL